LVAAGVYLIARMHVLFTIAPPVQELLAVIGAVTLLLAAASALAQSDIKRILAYSTISQIGYMFLALGVGAWSAAIFHFMTHAFFKSLLFLASGVVIKSLGDQRNIFKMGGLYRELPVAFWTFMIGAASLSALPLITAGFYSKDLILSAAFTSEHGSTWLWAAGIIGAFLTGLYTFRMFFIVFFGKMKSRILEKPGISVQMPLIVLAILSLISGFIQMPAIIAPVNLFSDFLTRSLPVLRLFPVNSTIEILLLFVAMLAPIAGLLTAWWFFVYRPQMANALAANPFGAVIRRFWFAGWGFDTLYNFLLVRPLIVISRLNRNDFIETFYRGIAGLFAYLSGLITGTQTGLVRRYALGIVLGTVIGIGIILIL
ncbi:MAG: proton-conducting transporter membrane subunit, partial [Smithella sp.]